MENYFEESNSKLIKTISNGEEVDDCMDDDFKDW